MDLPLSLLDRFAALGGVPARPAADRDARETAYNLLSAAIGVHSALLPRAAEAERGALDKEARRLLDLEARLPFLDGAELGAVAAEYPEALRALRGRHRFGPAPAAPKPLGAGELRAAFDRALRDRLSGAPREEPEALIFGGQPGSGKSTLQRALLPALAPGTVSYDGDDLMRLSPDYEAAMTADDRAASAALPAQVRGLHPMALEHVREGRSDVLCSHPLGRADWAAAWTEGFREAGYRVGVAFVAADFGESAAAIEERYRRSRREQGFGRWMPPEHHERAYAGVPNTAEFLETHRLADALYVVSRDGALLYAARLGPDGEWEKEPFARTALEAARARH
ncbi:zeta toxin family protein [Nocardiopsis potens]|uniref:zeta toxin family protein n=1 Tax=Nocardiopsis potens TaxID=1246458 RepID=UPI000348B8EB|nr:zeta toxin family protein [Nocardiopsis potens]